MRAPAATIVAKTAHVYFLKIFDDDLSGVN